MHMHGPSLCDTYLSEVHTLGLSRKLGFSRLRSTRFNTFFLLMVCIYVFMYVCNNY